MAPLANDRSKLALGRRWDDGFVNQRLLGLGMGILAAGILTGLLRLIQSFATM